MTQVTDLTAALEELMADKDLGADDIATILVDQGWTKVVKDIKNVKVEPGMPVEVLYQGSWVNGRVIDVGPGGLASVGHERGTTSAYVKGLNIRLPQ